jgi:hypothetical protein
VSSPVRLVCMLRTIALHDSSFAHSVGDTFSTDAEQAAELVRRGNAVYADGLEPPVREIPNAEQRAEAPRDEISESPELEAAAVKRPYGNATKGEWIAYALSVDPDLTEEAAGEMSKVSLMTAYGERL